MDEEEPERKVESPQDSATAASPLTSSAGKKRKRDESWIVNKKKVTDQPLTSRGENNSDIEKEEEEDVGVGRKRKRRAAVIVDSDSEEDVQEVLAR